MTSAEDRLAEIAARAKADIKKGIAPTPCSTTIREFIGWFGYERRGSRLEEVIRRALAKTELQTTPDFASGWIDEPISISLAEQENVDPTVRIGTLEAAHREPLTVTSDQPLQRATTLMAMHHYSQLPVTQDLREIRGIVSWKSIGSKLSLGSPCTDIKDCMESHHETRIDEPLLNAITPICKHGYTLVRGKERKITGIVTAADIGSQFIQLAGPFLIIEEIERYLRSLSYNKLNADELQSAADPDATRDIQGIADLSFGELCRFLGSPENWERLQLKLHRKTFINRLEDIRKIRNDVMHFDPDGLDPDQRTTLNYTVDFFRNLRHQGVI